MFASTLAIAIVLAVLAGSNGGEVLLRVDEPVAEWIADNRTDAWTDFFNTVSHFGDNVVIFSVALVLAAWTWTRCRYLAITLVLAAMFIHKGSAESKDGNEKVEASLRRIEERLGTLPGDAPSGEGETWKLPDTQLKAADRAAQR